MKELICVTICVLEQFNVAVSSSLSRDITMAWWTHSPFRPCIWSDDNVRLDSNLPLDFYVYSKIKCK